MDQRKESLQRIGRENGEIISPMRERDTFFNKFKVGGKMGKSWLTLVLVIVIVTVFVVFNYQEGRDAVPLSEIFPDEKAVSHDVAYEFVEEEPAAPAPATTVTAVVPAPAPTKAPEKAAIVASAPSVASTANYTVQIASFKDKKRAEEALANIQIKVPSAYMAARDLGTKGTWYRIYAGQFDQRRQAEVTLNDIKKDFDSSFIISSKSSK